jgi:phosphoribosylamine--glycine ligase
MRLESDLLDLLEAALDGRLDRVDARWDPRPAVGVVVAAAGYPGTVRSGDRIVGLDRDCGPDVKVFHAATRREGDALVTAGGRVLTVCALGDDLAQARERVHDALREIRFDGAFHRRDIGHRALAPRR